MSADLAYARMAERAVGRPAWFRAYQDLEAMAAELGWTLIDPAEAEWYTPDEILVALQVRMDVCEREPAPAVSLWHDGLVMLNLVVPCSAYPAGVFRPTLDAVLDTLRRLRDELEP